MIIGDSGFILNTSRGFVPNLCMDMMEKAIEKCRNKIAAIKIYVDTMLENKRMVSGCPMTTRQFYNIPSSIPIIMSVNNQKYYLLESMNTVNNGADWITIDNASGLSKMTMQDYKKVIDIWKPDMFIIPSDHYKIIPSDAVVKEKKQRRIMERNKNYLKHFEEYSNAIQTVSMAQEPIKSNCDIYEIIATADNVQMIKSMADRLPNNSKKYLAGPVHPSNIRKLGGIINYFDTSFVDQITNINNALVIRGDQIELLDLNDSKYAMNMNRIDDTCECWTCLGEEAVTLSYLYHLVDTREMLVSVMLQSHNLYQYASRSIE